MSAEGAIVTERVPEIGERARVFHHDGFEHVGVVHGVRFHGQEVFLRIDRADSPWCEMRPQPLLGVDKLDHRSLCDGPVFLRNDGVKVPFRR